MTKKNKIAIIGYGRFGKLYANILKPFADIFILSQREIKGVSQIDFKDLGDMDIVIPCVPISKFENIIKKISSKLKKDAMVMDVCSVKVYPVQIMKKYLSKDIEILATHPMFGPDSAKHGTNGLQIVICPVRINNKKLKFILNIFKKLKLEIINTSPEDHDKQSAISLSLVHFIGRGLGELNVNEQKISTIGFERLLTVNETVSNDTWELFLDMNNYNPYTKKIRKKYIKALQNLDNKLNIKEKK